MTRKEVIFILESYLSSTDAESCLQELEKAGIVKKEFMDCGCCWEHKWDEE